MSFERKTIETFSPRVAAGWDNCQTQLLYFTSSSLSEDDQTVFFISDRDGHSNIYGRQGDTLTQYSFNRNGIMYS